MTAHLLQLIRRADCPLSKTALADKSGLSLSAVSDHVERLLKEKLIKVANVGKSSGGRKPRLYTLNRHAGNVVSIELGTSSARAALCDFDCSVICHDRAAVDLSEGPENVLNRVLALVAGLLARHGIRKETVMGIGIGIPSPVEFVSGLPVSPPIMPGWDRYPIREFWAKHFDCPCYVDNDVNVMALGEHAKGLSFEVDNMIYVKIGTGIGAGVIYDGSLYRGASGSAGDIGHFDVGADVLCWCGNTGCLEAMAGGKAIAGKAMELAVSGRSRFLQAALQEKGELSLQDIRAGIEQLDPLCTELIRESGEWVGRVIASLVNFSNPSLVVIGGGVAEFGDVFLASVRQGIYRRSLPLATRNLQINKSILGKMSGLIGCAFMTVDQLILGSTDNKPETFLTSSR